MKAIRVVSLAVVSMAVLHSSAPAQAPPAETPSALEKELAALHGKWETESIINDGETQTDTLRVEITEQRFSVQIGDTTLALRMKIDPTCTPKLLDLSRDSEAETTVDEDFLAEGIYELEPDKLRICVTLPKDVRERPQKFEAPTGSGRVLITLRRAGK